MTFSRRRVEDAKVSQIARAGQQQHASQQPRDVNVKKVDQMPITRPSRTPN
jgi:hypothetical protein